VFPVTLEQLQALFPFQLDGFQAKAVQQMLSGKSVMVCAPTGARGRWSGVGQLCAGVLWVCSKSLLLKGGTQVAARGTAPKPHRHTTLHPRITSHPTPHHTRSCRCGQDSNRRGCCRRHARARAACDLHHAPQGTRTSVWSGQACSVGTRPMAAVKRCRQATHSVLTLLSLCLALNSPLPLSL
jgi:hypothetical protein